MKFTIEEIRCGVSENAKKAGLIPGAVVSSIRYRMDDRTEWVHCMDLQGLSFFVSDDDIHDELLDDLLPDEDMDRMNQFLVDSFHGVDLGLFKDMTGPNDLDDMIPVIEYDSDIRDDVRTIFRLICYLVALTLCPSENTDACIEEGLGMDPDRIDLWTISDLLG